MGREAGEVDVPEGAGQAGGVGPEGAYRQAGVDIDAGNRVVSLIRSSVRSTHRPGVLGDVGGFGGFFALPPGYREPVLVAGADGVGTKLRLAFALEQHRTVGIDCVAMNVNDILTHGAEPLFFLDYLAVGHLTPEQAAAVVEGVAEGCRQAGCALLGGETAEMPGFYAPGEYDLAGFAVGVVEKSRLLDGSRVRPGDILLGLSSSGVHSNGFSLVRRTLLGDTAASPLSLTELRRRLEGRPPELGGRTLGEVLLQPTRIYVRAVLSLLKGPQGGGVHGMAHITGGGIVENVPRVVPAGGQVVVQRGSWPVSPVFALIRRTGSIGEEEMYRVFNMGIGFVLIVDPGQVDQVQEQLADAGEGVYRIGYIASGTGFVFRGDAGRC